jgi:hypothetical protein
MSNKQRELVQSLSVFLIRLVNITTHSLSNSLNNSGMCLQTLCTAAQNLHFLHEQIEFWIAESKDEETYILNHIFKPEFNS